MKCEPEFPGFFKGKKKRGGGGKWEKQLVPTLAKTRFRNVKGKVVRIHS